MEKRWTPFTFNRKIIENSYNLTTQKIVCIHKIRLKKMDTYKHDTNLNQLIEANTAFTQINKHSFVCSFNHFNRLPQFYCDAVDDTCKMIASCAKKKYYKQKH